MSSIYFLLIFVHAPLCFVHSGGFPRKVSCFYNPEGCKQAGFFHPLTAALSSAARANVLRAWCGVY